MRVADGEPGVECQIDFAQLGSAARPRDRTAAAGARADLHRGAQPAHVRVVDLLPDPGRGDRRLRGGVGLLRRRVQGADPGQPEAGGHRRPTRSTRGSSHGLVGLRPARRVRHRPGPGPLTRRTSRGSSGSCSTCAATSGPGSPSLDLADAQAPGRGLVRATGPGCGSTAPPSAAPLEMFAELEAGCLLPVPAAYDVPIFTRVKVHRDFHVEVAKALYSVPEAVPRPTPRRPRRQRAGQALLHRSGAAGWSRPIRGSHPAAGPPTRATCPNTRPATRCGT